MMGSWMGTTLGPNFSLTTAMTFSKEAFSRSIWLMTIMRGLFWAWHMAMAFSAPTTGPETAPTTMRALSARNAAEATSP